MNTSVHNTAHTDSKTEKLPVTAIVHTRNAERYLDEVLDRLKDFDEILLVDMDSSDRTLDIARRHGCRILSVEPVGYVEPARDPAMRAAKHDWVFFVDADEIIPPAFVEWLREFIKNTGETKAVGVPRMNGFLNTWTPATYPDYQIRLLDRRHASWPPHVHSNPQIDGPTYLIPRKRHDLAMRHKAPTIEEMMERLNRYTTLEMERKRDKKINFLTLWLRPQVRFFKSFILKGGFRKGLAGYIAAKHDAAYQHYYLTKIYEQKLPKDRPGF